METAEQVLRFWLKDVGPKGWYEVSPELDEQISSRFAPLWERAREGRLTQWQSNPRGALAYLIVTDQFPRNMFRGDPRAFATDGLALSAAIRACHHKLDLQVPEPERQFFYLPLMHSESPFDQDRCVRMFLTRMPETGMQNLLHARAHRKVIRDFGRFPYRNDALSRDSTPAEQVFLDRGGYGEVVRELQLAA
ncbi:DUF924 domain-containing protein [Rhodobacteraceae bacterium 2376]|uniref:DUF924 domain-containing protein n=1 Tax=Rhabdonatronobacter sediminivivens TaxID=2743469 RepID=A0A7Z0HWJ6_9RHOB|nr:DUF924 family protein [Rhabdonatronobacter sediminivivens]NYS23455.1 DUF924 domain-containing protein [Rhabdonatronobacter sediminivivens]